MLGNFWKDMAFVGFHDWGEHGEWLTIDGLFYDMIFIIIDRRKYSF